MEILKTNEEGKLNIALVGRLDTTSAPTLEAELNTALEGVTELVFDMKGLEYTSSAGLRVLLSTQKKMNAQGKMIVTNVNDDIMEIFKITGFADILTIQ